MEFTFREDSVQSQHPHTAAHRNTVNRHSGVVLTLLCRRNVRSPATAAVIRAPQVAVQQVGCRWAAVVRARGCSYQALTWSAFTLHQGDVM